MASIAARGTERRVDANPAELAALAELLDLPAVSSLTATVSLRRLASGLIEARGHLEADVVQECVVTLEPLPAHVAEDFRVTYGEAEPAPTLAEIDLDYEEADPPEPIEGGIIDLGALVAEHLALGLDPYPRKVGAELPQEFEPKNEPASESAKGETRKPFAGLDKLVRKED